MHESTNFIFHSCGCALWLGYALIHLLIVDIDYAVIWPRNRDHDDDGDAGDGRSEAYYGSFGIATDETEDIMCYSNRLR